MKEQPVHQKRKTHHTRTEPLPRAININDLEHGKDSSSLRSPSPLSRYQACICERLNVFVYFLCIQLCDLNFYFKRMYSYVFMCTRLCFCLLCSYTVCQNKLQYTINKQIQLLYLGLSLQPRNSHIAHLFTFVTTGTGSLHSSGLDGPAAEASPSHCYPRWSTGPSTSPSLAQQDISLQRIVAEVKVLTYAISRVLHKAHDGGGPSNSRSS